LTSGASRPSTRPDEDDPETSGDERGAPLRDERGVSLTGENEPSPDPPLTTSTGARARCGTKTPLHEGETEFDVPETAISSSGQPGELSQDSRFWGYVRRDLIVGRALFVYCLTTRARRRRAIS
jgi:hypothetical protein